MYTNQHKLISIALAISLALSTVPFVYASKEDNNGKSDDAHTQNEERKEENIDSHGNPHNEDPIIFIEQSGPDSGDNLHPSGNDRSEEHGNSGTQGKSQSDPDGTENSNGGNSGKDKYGFDGGFDKADQDGNNGCGNDDDFEDDNNGNCGGRSKEKPSPTPAPKNPDKNPGGCDTNGSNGDQHGKPCNPGNNNASPRGCEHGEPDCPNVGSPVNPTPTPTSVPTPTVTPTPTKSGSNATPTPTPEQSVLGATSENKGSTLPWTGNFLYQLGIMLTVGGAYIVLFGLLPYIKQKAYEFAYPKSNSLVYKHEFLL